MPGVEKIGNWVRGRLGEWEMVRLGDGEMEC
jgi:hypothetical protein